jgi:UDP-N-acetylglucosamine:LPS N-acetylglucosamine transferase
MPTSASSELNAHKDGSSVPASPVNVAFIPSVSGGLGHVGRTLKLARALERTDPTLQICYVLDELELRPLNVDVVARTGYAYRMLPNPVHHERTEKIRAVLGDIDVVIEDTNRRLIAHRRILPRLRVWISIPMLPIWDELHMDGPLLEHADHILYTYPAVMPPPEELLPFHHKLTVTGPILDPEEMPSRAEARHRLGLDPEAGYVTYAPRGFPFGAWFGRRVLNGVVGGVMRLRRQRPGLHLVLTAVPDVAAVQPPRLPPLDQIDGVEVVGTVSPETARDYVAAANAVVLEGTSTLFDAALARTPVVMVPGLIHETALEGTWVNEGGAGIVLRPEHVTHRTMAWALGAALDPVEGRERSERLFTFVGTGGRDLAVSTILRVIAERVRS